MKFPTTDEEYSIATFVAALVLAVITAAHLVVTVLFSLEISDFRKRLAGLEATVEHQYTPPKKLK